MALKRFGFQRRIISPLKSTFLGRHFGLRHYILQNDFKHTICFYLYDLQNKVSHDRSTFKVLDFTLTTLVWRQEKNIQLLGQQLLYITPTACAKARLKILISLNVSE